MIIVVIGVSASGKSTVGKLLAEQLGWQFFEGDDFHPAANVAKMSRGAPLTDDDRRPWLESIRGLIRSLSAQGRNAVIACSALKQSYRDMLRIGGEVTFLYLDADFAMIRERLKRRTGHFMHPELLQSQFDVLEQPRHALRIDAALTPAAIVHTVRRRWSI